MAEGRYLSVDRASRQGEPDPDEEHEDRCLGIAASSGPVQEEEGHVLEALVGRVGGNANRLLRILRIARAKMVRKLTTTLGRSLRPFSVRLADTEPVYCQALPTNQTIADVMKGGWCSRFPDEYAVEAGRLAHFDPTVEQRVTWVHDALPGGVRGLSVLELGPFELEFR